jgi:hypothetical protein
MKSWPELIGSGNPEAHDYGAGLKELHSTPESMVDRVAYALAKHYHQGKVTTAEQSWPLFMPEARVVIAAMREPTKEMLKASGTATDCAYKRMIDAALKE